MLPRKIATLAQTKGGVKDVQGVLAHGKAHITVNVCVQPIEAGVKRTFDAIQPELTAQDAKSQGSKGQLDRSCVAEQRVFLRQHAVWGEMDS